MTVGDYEPSVPSTIDFAKSATMFVVLIGGLIALPLGISQIFNGIWPHEIGAGRLSLAISAVVTITIYSMGGAYAIFRDYTAEKKRLVTLKADYADLKTQTDRLLIDSARSSALGDIVFVNRDDNDYWKKLDELLKSAKSISVLGISNDRFSIQLDQEVLSNFLSQDRAELRLAFLNPNSAASAQRAATEGWPSSFLNERTSQNLSVLNGMISELSDYARRRLSIRLYDFAPTQSIIIIDSFHVFVHSYHTKMRGNQSPAFYFDSSRFPQIVASYVSEFEAAWIKSEPIPN